MIRYITDDLEICSFDSDRGNSDKKDWKRIILTMMSFLRRNFKWNYFWISIDALFEGENYMLKVLFYYVF